MGKNGAKNKGKEPPVFLSTHPSSKKRIENLNGWISEVIVNTPNKNNYYW